VEVVRQDLVYSAAKLSWGATVFVGSPSSSKKENSSIMNIPSVAKTVMVVIYQWR